MGSVGTAVRVKRGQGGCDLRTLSPNWPRPSIVYEGGGAGYTVGTELGVKRIPERQNKGLLSFFLQHRYTHVSTPLHTSLYTLMKMSTETHQHRPNAHPHPQYAQPSNCTELSGYTQGSWKYFGKGLGNPGDWGRGGGCISQRKKPERQGPLTSLCVRKTPARSLPIKHRALGDSADSWVSSCVFPDVPASACLHSVSNRRVWANA